MGIKLYYTTVTASREVRINPWPCGLSKREVHVKNAEFNTVEMEDYRLLATPSCSVTIHLATFNRYCKIERI